MFLTVLAILSIVVYILMVLFAIAVSKQNGSVTILTLLILFAYTWGVYYLAVNYG
jgi:hypothetical protein